MADDSLQWLPLDNAAKIYPAARRKKWSNVYRLSATLTEPVDPAVLQSALDVTVRRFPSLAVRLRRGMFWYYLQQLPGAPSISREYSYPLVWMDKHELRRCAFRVIAHDRRIAVELFHSLTDGSGGLIFLKSLVAEYLEQKYKITIPTGDGILDRREAPKPEELEDSFLKNAAPIQASRRENTAWHLSGTREEDGFLHVTCFRVPVQAMVDKAHEYGVSLTAFLTAAMMQALQQWQKELYPQQHRKPVKVLIPVNLRNLFPSRTMRNFALYTTPELLTRLGECSFEEICHVVKTKMAEDITPKQMSMKIATNVFSEKLMAVRILPLFIKNIVMKAVFDATGETKSCLCLSNLGQVKLPENMMEHIERLDFVLGVQATSPYNCGVVSFKDQMYINFIRNTKEADLERYFYQVLHSMGLPVQVQTNG